MSQRRRRLRRFLTHHDDLTTFTRWLAEQLADGDLDLEDDLAQEGLIGAWLGSDGKGRTKRARRRRTRRAAAHRMFKYMNAKGEEQCATI